MNRTIIQIYSELELPPNLQLHMLRTAAVAHLIADNWQGPELSLRKILRVLLLHDAGNVVKINYDKSPGVLGADVRDIERWKRLQREFIEKYGTDDHKVSRRIATECGCSSDELELMDAKVFVKNDITVALSNFDVKVAAYADQRVGPQGVMPLLDRLREAQARYRDVPGSSMNNPRTEFLIDCAQRIERQVMQFCRLSPEAITDVTIAPYLEKLRSYEIAG